MTADQAFLQLFQKFMPNASTISIGTVKSVDKKNHTCDIERDGQPELFNCRLNATADAHDSFVVSFPAVGSYVAVLVFSKENTDSLVIATTGIEEISAKIGKTTMLITDKDIVFNGGELGGLAKLSELTSKINDFVRVFNTHTHVVNTTGTASSQSGMALISQTQQSVFKVDDYENKNVKHG